MIRRNFHYILYIGLLSRAFILEAAAEADGALRKIGEMELSLLGIAARVEPIHPVVPKNIASGVRIVVRAGAAELTPDEVAQFLGGAFEVVGEISGPGLPAALTVPPPIEPGEPPPADPLLLPLPPLTVPGDYTLANLRIEVDGKPALDVSPRSITVEVIHQVLVTSVKTRPLTLDELKERGVVFDDDDYLGFEFTVGMLLESNPVNITFPVVFDREGVPVPQPVSAPIGSGRDEVDLGPLPTIVPVMLEPAGDFSMPVLELPNGTSQPIRIPSVIVIPGNVGYLKQFFSAQLYVANGAPVGRDWLSKTSLEESVFPPDPIKLPEPTTIPWHFPIRWKGRTPTRFPSTILGRMGSAAPVTTGWRFIPGSKEKPSF